MIIGSPFFAPSAGSKPLRGVQGCRFAGFQVQGACGAFKAAARGSRLKVQKRVSEASGRFHWSFVICHWSVVSGRGKDNSRIQIQLRPLNSRRENSQGVEFF
jgi:hypothetical protein